MKKLFILSALIVGSLSFQAAKAQIGVHLNVNLGARPVYVPAPQPVMSDEYYYLPDAEAYYSVPQHVYYYQYEGRWISGARMPGRYRDFDYNHMRHYAVNESRPYLRNDYYRDHFRNQQFANRGNGGFRNQPNNDYRGRDDHRENNYNHRDQNYRHDDHDSRGGRDDHENNHSRH